MDKRPNKKALFILHEGIGSTIFNSQVIEHARGMKKFGLDFDILAYDTFAKTWDLSNKNLLKFKTTDPDIKIMLKKAMNIYYPFSSFYNLLLLVAFFIKNKAHYSFIQGRADYTTFLCLLAKPFHGLPVYWDCRGDAVSELEDSLSRKNSVIRFIGNIYLVGFNRIVAYFNCKMSNGAIFVSRALSAIFLKKLKTKRYEIIPCPVSEEKFFFDTELRRTMREKLNIAAHKSVYLYSGSMVAYQSLQQQYEQYEAILKNPDNMVIIATSQPDVAHEFFKSLKSDQLMITSVSFSEMNAYYNLSDFAFLMRDKKQLNYVASPTKFGEYCLTGLPVIMNETVDQAFTVSKELNNYVSHLNLTSEKFNDQKRAAISVKARDFYSRKVLNLSYVRLYETNLN